MGEARKKTSRLTIGKKRTGSFQFQQATFANEANQTFPPLVALGFYNLPTVKGKPRPLMNREYSTGVGTVRKWWELESQERPRETLG